MEIYRFTLYLFWIHEYMLNWFNCQLTKRKIEFKSTTSVVVFCKYIIIEYINTRGNTHCTYNIYTWINFNLKLLQRTFWASSVISRVIVYSATPNLWLKHLLYFTIYIILIHKLHVCIFKLSDKQTLIFTYGTFAIISYPSCTIASQVPSLSVRAW